MADYVELPISEITNPYLEHTVRAKETIEPYIDRIAESITKEGQLNRVVVFARENKKEVISGRFLFEAVKKLGHETVKCVVVRECVAIPVFASEEVAFLDRVTKGRR